MQCSVCGGSGTTDTPVLWPELIRDWALAPHEAAYIDLQQGRQCQDCRANLRSIVLATAILSALGLPAPLRHSLPRATARILEVNEAGTLHPVLASAPDLTYAAYPQIDMQALPYPDASFDLVVHSDTLEHVPHPLRALSECARVLRPGGALCYTVPTIVERLTRRRDGLPASHHGAPGDGRDDHLVISEYGADMWTEPLRAGFASVQIFARDYPAGLALLARR